MIKENGYWQRQRRHHRRERFRMVRELADLLPDLEGYLSVSRRNVPMLIIKGPSFDLSTCWFTSKLNHSPKFRTFTRYTPLSADVEQPERLRAEIKSGFIHLEYPEGVVNEPQPQSSYDTYTVEEAAVQIKKLIQ